MRFDLREPSRPGLVGDKLQSGESGDTTLPLLLFFFFVGGPVCCSLEPGCCPKSLAAATASWRFALSFRYLVTPSASATTCAWELGDIVSYLLADAFGYMLGDFAVDLATCDLRMCFGEGSLLWCFGDIARAVTVCFQPKMARILAQESERGGPSRSTMPHLRGTPAAAMKHAPCACLPAPCRHSERPSFSCPPPPNASR